MDELGKQLGFNIKMVGTILVKDIKKMEEVDCWRNMMYYSSQINNGYLFKLQMETI